MIPVFPTAERFFHLLLMAALLVPASVFVVAASWNRAEVTRAGLDTVARTAAAMDEHARKVFDTVDLALARVDDRIQFLTWDEIASPATSDFLRTLKHPLAQAVSIWVADANGFVRAGSQPWDPKISIADRDFFRAHAKENVGTFISQPFTGRATRTASFAMSRRRTTPDGRFDGTIHIALSPDYFARFYQEMTPAGAHSATLLRQDGLVLVRQPPTGDAARQVPPLPDLARAPERVVNRGVPEPGGEDSLYAIRRVSPYPVFVLFTTDMATVLQTWWDNLKLYGLVALAASFTLLGVSALALRRFAAEQAALQRLTEETEQRLAAEQRLRQAQKMESIGQLTGGIAHDFNNLLAVIIGNLELAKKRMTPEPRVQRLLDGALLGAQRGASLTQRLLAFARKQDLAPAVVDIAQLVGNMADLVRRSLGHATEVRTEFPPELPRVEVDPHQLELTLLNLAVNARDAMPNGGTVTISAREETVGPSNTLGISGGDYVCIRVADHGAGMDEATLAKATEPFFTTKGVGKGTGLGLSMAQGFVVQSGGTMRLLSKPGRGTTVELWLPRAGAGAGHESAAPRAAAPVASRAVRILLVEDDHLVALSTAAMLEDLGHAVVQAPSGPEALATLERDGAIDLVITDFSMPGMDGVQLAQAIRRTWPALPVMIASGQSEVGQLSDLPKLMKPYRQEDLAAAIGRLLAARAVPAQ